MIYEDTADYQRYMQFTANPRQPSPYYTTKLVPPIKDLPGTGAPAR